MKPSVKPAAHLRVERPPTIPWNPCPTSVEWALQVHKVRQWRRIHRRIHRRKGPRLDRVRRGKDRLHRNGITLGERILRKLQRPIPRRTPQRRGVPHPARGPDPHREMAPPLPQRPAPQRLGIPPPSAGNHRPDGAGADHAPTLNPGPSGGGSPRPFSMLEVDCSPARNWRARAASLPVGAKEAGNRLATSLPLGEISR